MVNGYFVDGCRFVRMSVKEECGGSSYGVGQLRIYLSRGISLETGKPTVYSCVSGRPESAVMQTENVTASFCAVSKLDLLDKFGECLFFLQFMRKYNFKMFNISIIKFLGWDKSLMK